MVLKRVFRKKVIACISICAMLFSFTPETQGAIYTFSQSDWSGDITATTATHSSNQTGWNEFNAKGTNLVAGTDLQLNNVISTANIDFNTESYYNQQSAANGTDFSGGAVTLKKTDLVATGGNQTYTYGNYTVRVFKSSGTFSVTSPGEIDYLIVGGGGSGGAGDNNAGGGGGGGAGGVVFRTNQSVANGSHSVVVGAGGVATTSTGQKGGSSSFRGYTGIGGGAGAYADQSGLAGGSGGGGSRYYNPGGAAQQPGSASGGYGYAGGRAYNARAAAGGGGGSGGAGVTPTSTNYGGAGGYGRNYSSYFGTGVGESGYFASGGGGGGNGAANRTGTSRAGGGGGNDDNTNWAGAPGMANTGGGGAGGDGLSGTNRAGGAGGTGVVIVRYLTAPNYPTSTYYYVTTRAESQIDTSSWGAINDVNITRSQPTNTTTKYLVSFDGRSTWKYWNGSSWADSALGDIGTNGMYTSAIQNLTQSQWAQVFSSGTLDFAVALRTTDQFTTPSIDNIAVDYTVPQIQTLTSSTFDAEISTAAISQITWNESLDSNTDVEFQIRTSSDGVTWGAWCGPDDGVNGSCNSATYFTDPLGGEVIDDMQKDHVNDQYFQYKAFLSTTDGQNTPTLSDVSVFYDDRTFAVSSTEVVSDITTITATGNGAVTDTGGEDPERFIEWGTVSGSYTDQCSAGIGSVGNYSCDITNIQPNTTYYYRAKVTNSVGTTYDAEQSFVTLGDVTIVDPDPIDIGQAVNDKRFVVDNGTIDNATQIVSRVNVTLREKGNSALFSPSTQITERSGGSYDFRNFVFERISVGSEQPDSRLAMRLGIEGKKLDFSQDITMTMFVGHAYNDLEMEVYYKEEGESSWNLHTTCVVSNGECVFVTDHATIYTINGQLQSEGDAPININTEVQSTITLDCHDASGGTGDYDVILGTVADPGMVTAGVPVVGQSICTVTTNDEQGYYLTIVDDNASANTVLTHDDPYISTTYEIADLTQYSFASPNTQNWTAPTTKGLGFSVISFPDTDLSNNQFNGTWTTTGNLCQESVGSDDAEYAGVPDTSETISAVTQYESGQTTTGICYKVDVPATQPSGIYQGSVTYTATSDASSYLN